MKKQAGLKISGAYWLSCNRVEQDYIQDRCYENFDRTGRYDVSGVKCVIAAVRVFFKGREVSRIYGKGFVSCEGSTYLYSGEDTRTFHKTSDKEILSFNTKLGQIALQL